MAAQPPLSVREVERVLRRLEPLIADRRVILIGGQAVALWTRLLSPYSEQLATQAPVASSDGFEREIDFIAAPLGLHHRDVRDTAVRVLLPDASGDPTIPLWVMHPERCMESRVVNAVELRKTQPLALRQLRGSIICARLWSRVILDADDVPEEQRVRAVLRLNERVFRKCLHDRRFRDVVLDHDIDPFDAVLVDDPRLPDRLRVRRHPQMRQQLDDRLMRDRRNRRRRHDDGRPPRTA